MCVVRFVDIHNPLLCILLLLLSYFYEHYDIANIASCHASGIVPGVFMNKRQFYK